MLLAGAAPARAAPKKACFFYKAPVMSRLTRIPLRLGDLGDGLEEGERLLWYNGVSKRFKAV
jgi:hypothetical protein